MTPLSNSFFRNSIGLEELFNEAFNIPKVNSYPPYNIIRVDEENYFIELAVAGFDKEDFDIEINKHTLSVKATVSEEAEKDVQYVYKGIAARSFERKFTLASTVSIESVKLNQGILTIRLKNIIPEEQKTKKIKIK